MQKATKLLSIVNIILSVFVILIIIQYFIESSQPSDSWTDLGLFLIAFVFLFLSIILTIPFIVFLIKYKFHNIKGYALTHLVFLALTMITFIFSLS